MNTVRPLRDAEKALLTHLIVGKLRAAHLLSSISDALVEEMNDGGMGGLRFCASDARPRCLGEQLVEREFVDSDGIQVMVVVNLDEHGNLYELDMWKVDFSPLKQFPTVTK
ncbi:DUF6984 family protein [Paraburkholderia sp.]|uniref:DUF6984 family protein n=1 Tax=Paraburkholderia sp. TaxID=1926495 RepID=UPI002F400D50